MADKVVKMLRDDELEILHEEVVTQEHMPDFKVDRHVLQGLLEELRGRRNVQPAFVITMKDDESVSEFKARWETMLREAKRRHPELVPWPDTAPTVRLSLDDWQVVKDVREGLALACRIAEETDSDMLPVVLDAARGRLDRLLVKTGDLPEQDLPPQTLMVTGEVPKHLRDNFDERWLELMRAAGFDPKIGKEWDIEQRVTMGSTEQEATENAEGQGQEDAETAPAATAGPEDDREEKRRGPEDPTQEG